MARKSDVRLALEAVIEALKLKGKKITEKDIQFLLEESKPELAKVELKTELPVEVKRGRGRPKLVKTEEEVTVKRGRGRPPRIQQPEEVEKRKPGRPKKIQEPVQQIQESTQKRGRGRPPKTQVQPQIQKAASNFKVMAKHPLVTFETEGDRDYITGIQTVDRGSGAQLELYQAAGETSTKPEEIRKAIVIKAIAEAQKVFKQCADFMLNPKNNKKIQTYRRVIQEPTTKGGATVVLQYRVPEVNGNTFKPRMEVASILNFEQEDEIVKKAIPICSPTDAKKMEQASIIFQRESMRQKKLIN